MEAFFSLTRSVRCGGARQGRRLGDLRGGHIPLYAQTRPRNWRFRKDDGARACAERRDGCMARDGAPRSDELQRKLAKWRLRAGEMLRKKCKEVQVYGTRTCTASSHFPPAPIAASRPGPVPSSSPRRIAKRARTQIMSCTAAVPRSCMLGRWCASSLLANLGGPSRSCGRSGLPHDVHSGWPRNSALCQIERTNIQKKSGNERENTSARRMLNAVRIRPCYFPFHRHLTSPHLRSPACCTGPTR